MKQLHWKLKSFHDLNVMELYSILQLRNEVFVVEQNCPYQDADGKDQKSYHLMGSNAEGKLMAYARLLPGGVSYDEVSIGRVVSSPQARGTGAGKELMEQAIEDCHELFGKGPIRIGAQLYLKKFYESFGFLQVSEPYLEDNIPHILMVKE